MAWWQSFFDDDYLRLWTSFLTPERTAREVDQLWELLDLAPGARVLDAPCGSGRIARGLAERGAHVVGVDQSAELLGEAERTRGELATEQLRYIRADLRQPLVENGFDVALNIFSSFGYGSEADDVAMFSTLAAAIRPGGTVVIESNHRDPVVAKLVRGDGNEHVLPDGTRFTETLDFDAVRGRVESTWRWSGPGGSGEKRSTLRVYALPELVALVERAGLTVRSVNAGLTREPYHSTLERPTSRVAVIATR